MDTNEFKKTYAEIKADPTLYAEYLDRKRKERKARAGYEAKRKAAWRRANAEKSGKLRAAHRSVEKALTEGRLIKPKTCSRCGAGSYIEAHHHKGYDQKYWLDIVWLCSMCHAREHHPEH